MNELNQLKGLGSKRIEAINKAEIFNLTDLLNFVPTKYLDTHDLTDMGKLEEDKTVFFKCRVVTQPKNTYFGGKCLLKLQVEITNNTPTNNQRRHEATNQRRHEATSPSSHEATNQGIVPPQLIECLWYNNRFVSKQLKCGSEYYLSGTTKKKGKLYISAPRIYSCKDCLSRIIPVYKSIRGVPSKLITGAVGQILAVNSKLIGNNSSIFVGLSELVGSRFPDILPKINAYRMIHLPQNLEEVERARRSLVLEKLCVGLLKYYSMDTSEKRKNNYITYDKQLQNFVRGLKFELTDSQVLAFDEIVADMCSDTLMNRLLHGDVGSGKTIIAFLAVYFARLNGYQSILLAPTEVLAMQHFASAQKVFCNYDVKIALLIGSTTANREAIINGLRSGEIDFVIGTHSVLGDEVVYNRLGLLINDEQHRFGVEQRGSVLKRYSADYLALSATPIPRTLALSIFGQIKLSTITARRSKATISTKFVPASKMPDMYKYIIKNAENGEQTYIICSRIEDDEEDEQDLVSVKSLYKTLGLIAPPSIRIGMLHSQMKAADRESALTDFMSGKSRILVATTIVEVGLDAPNATTIVIFDSDRYGVAQLHQLRGRVGRGAKDSYCFLCSNALGADTQARLQFVRDNFDCYKLAEYDLENRGAGELFGTQQHGSGLLQQLKYDKPTMLQALDMAKELSLDKNIARNIINSVSLIDEYGDIVLN